MKFIGIDGCKAGWFYVALNAKQGWRLGVVQHIDKLHQLIAESRMALIDVPIGLREKNEKERLCDIQARLHLKPLRHASVFPVPARAALKAEGYLQASRINQQASGRKLSKQSWFIMPKIRQVDEYLAKFQGSQQLREMHPEICFWALNQEQAMQYNKKTELGFAERLELLSSIYPHSGEIVRQGLKQYSRTSVARDDILDALVGAISARWQCWATLPENPELDAHGLPMQVVYPKQKEVILGNHPVNVALEDRAIIKTPAGNMLLVASAETLLKAQWLEKDARECEPLSSALQSIVQQLHQYWRNPTIEFKFSSLQQGTLFSNRVWQQMCMIPVGDTRTYGELAIILRTSARAIGNACRNNPYPLFVPCHRVVSASGIGGYDGQTNGAKLNIKKILLAHEGKFKL